MRLGRPVPLGGMIWTTSLDTAHKVAREVRTGTEAKAIVMQFPS